MPRAGVNGIVLAESEHTEVVEGNHYFPPESVNLELFRESATRTHCPWKGDASHFTVEAGGKTAEDVAWYYPEPKDAAKNTKKTMWPATATRCEPRGNPPELPKRL